MASVLITGTSKGIGLEAALAFGRAGHQVHATMRNPSQSPALAETAAREKLPITISAMDVDSDESVSTAITRILENHGPVDVLVNNAGVEARGSGEELPLSVWRAVMETNYFGVLRCVQALLPQMRQRRSGCIINISSVAGRISVPPLTSYCASKWALEALSEGLAGEMKAFNVRVVLVEPGIIDTAMARRIGDPPAKSRYVHGARIAAMFSGSLTNPVPPTLVAEKILAIAESEDWTLRHPVGPDAIPLLQTRSQMRDEEWVDLNAGDDAAFFARLSGSN
jgi:NAD(P)-dependent dehydrogenase (short-subunit alcohol dehydrogenase family)